MVPSGCGGGGAGSIRTGLVALFPDLAGLAVAADVYEMLLLSLQWSTCSSKSGGILVLRSWVGRNPYFVVIEANNVDARGRRHLHGGVVLALI